MEYVEYLNLDFSDEKNIDIIMQYTLDFLEEINANEFNAKNIHKFSGIIDKFIYFSKHYGIANTYDLSEMCTKFIDTLIENDQSVSSIRRKECLSQFEKINSIIHRIFNEIRFIQINNEFGNEFSLFYNPNASNKETAIRLIEEVVDILNSDNTLPMKQKDTVIKQLNKILANLKSVKTNWTSYFGDICQTIIILGSLGSFVGGAASIVSLNLTTKLSESIQVIQSTSVNINSQFTYNLAGNISLKTLDNNLELRPSSTPLLGEK